MFSTLGHPANPFDARFAEHCRWLTDGQPLRSDREPCRPQSCDCEATARYTDEEIVDALRHGRPLTWCTLALRAERDDDPNLEITDPPYGVDRVLRPVPQGRLSPQARYLAVPVRNASPYAFAPDLVLEVSATGKAELARYRAFVLDSGTSETGVGGLDAGAERIVYFPVDTVDCVTGAARVEFQLRSGGAGKEIKGTAVTGTVQIWAPQPAVAVVVVRPAVAAARVEALDPVQATGGVRALRVQTP